MYAGELEKLAAREHDPPVWAAVFRQASKRENKDALARLRELIWLQTMRFLADSPITAVSTAIPLPRKGRIYHAMDPLTRVLDKDILETALDYVNEGKSVAVLIPAARGNAGGSVQKGRGAMEEGIYRRANM